MSFFLVFCCLWLSCSAWRLWRDRGECGGRFLRHRHAMLWLLSLWRGTVWPCCGCHHCGVAQCGHEPNNPGQPAPTSAFSNRTVSREKQVASIQPNVRKHRISVLFDDLLLKKNTTIAEMILMSGQPVCPASRSSGHSISDRDGHSAAGATAASFPPCHYVRPRHTTPARLASIREQADVRFTSLSLLAHATMDLHSQHTIAQDFVSKHFQFRVALDLRSSPYRHQPAVNDLGAHELDSLQTA
jgi:hypothetical protein